MRAGHPNSRMEIAAPSLKTRSVPALDRALNALELLASSKHGLTLPKVSAALKVPKSSAHSLLLTLERRGYFHCNLKTNRYLFGLQLFCLANMALAGMSSARRPAPFLRLMSRSRLTAHLALLEHNEAVLIDKAEPPGVYKLATWLGKRMELHCTNVGKAMLAYFSEDELDDLIRLRGLPRHNDNTISTAKRLRDELAKIRRMSYAIDDEEDEVGYRCIGAPIFDRNGKVLAGVSVSGDIEHVTGERVVAIAEHVKQCAGSVSALLGFEGAVG
jgi:DNA-binding IclR family transcriptional regulator